MNGLTFIIIIFGTLLFVGVVIYNRLVRDSNLIKEAWAGIDVQLKRRHDLIPKLMQVVEGVMAYEKKTLSDITRLRGESLNVSGMKDRARIESDLSASVKQILAVAENYPDLKSSQNFLDLQRSITDVEDHLQMARRYYNGTVRNFNTRIASIPTVFMAGPLGYRAAEFFEAEKSEREVPA